MSEEAVATPALGSFTWSDEDWPARTFWNALEWASAEFGPEHAVFDFESEKLRLSLGQLMVGDRFGRWSSSLHPQSGRSFVGSIRATGRTNSFTCSGTSSRG